MLSCTIESVFSNIKFEAMAVVLPDPTADLHWSDYRGAIHDIFAENTNKHPDRLCVVETASSTGLRREFTYRQIFEASCQLAHRLTASGIARGDVVMVYAHRSVHLVVAIFVIESPYISSQCLAEVMAGHIDVRCHLFSTRSSLPT